MDLPTPDDLRERRLTEPELTQAELADRAGVSQPLIARIENGDVDPRLSTLRSIVEALRAAEGDIVRARDVMNPEVAAVAPDDSVAAAVDLMGEKGYSQLPVVEGGVPEGMITNADVRHSEEPDLSAVPVADLMRRSIATVEPDTVLEEVNARLDHNKALIVYGEEGIEGIVTEADVAARYS